MRDIRFKAIHRGGLLTRKQHELLMEWACGCVKHVLELIDEKIDSSITHALALGIEWKEGNIRTGDALKAALSCISFAKTTNNPVMTAIARASGQAVATAHMADHSLGAAYYCLKAVKALVKSVEEERSWQTGQIPSEVKEMVLDGLAAKNIHV
jgi:hypothetical protein